MARKSRLSMLSVEALFKLRDDVAKVLSAKASELQKQLSQLTDGNSVGNGRRRTKKGRKVAPKYKGPKGELWSGRGMKPRWLVAEMKKGKRAEDFAIGKRGSKRKAA